jgi:dihydropteroate synthase
MTGGSAPVGTRSRTAIRLLWIEGRVPALGEIAVAARLGAPELAPDDARACFAVGRDEAETLRLPIRAWPAETPLPGALHEAWRRHALLVDAPRRPVEQHLAIRVELLRAAASDPRSELERAMLAALDEHAREERTLRWRGGQLRLLRGRPQVMAVLNLTPDSFSDGGRLNARAAIERGEQQVAAGAALLDLGGESTRPGARPVPAAEQIDRVVPAIEQLARRVAVPLSIDTTSAAVARAALSAGAVLVNDTSALLDDPGMADAVREHGAALVLMHRRAAPATMQDDPSYEDCAAEVAAALRERADSARAAGIPRESLLLDPGIGFGKRFGDNLDLCAALASFRSLGFPLLLGASRKAFLGTITGRPAAQRDAATLATTAAAFAAGCELVRVHDAGPSVDLLRVLSALYGPEGAPP